MPLRKRKSAALSSLRASDKTRSSIWSSSAAICCAASPIESAAAISMLSNSAALSSKVVPFPDTGLALLYAERGIVKTWIALGVAHAVASGGEFLCWRAERPRKVLYIDGEMPAHTLQERYAAVVRASMKDAPRENFRLAAADCQPDGLPDLSSEEAQRFYDAAIADAELIICDNLSTLAHGLRENEADSFGPVQSWMLEQRAAGRSVLLVHHAGKGGGQRGTSRDTLDTVISLSRPPGYSAAEGARFEVRFT